MPRHDPVPSRPRRPQADRAAYRARFRRTMGWMALAAIVSVLLALIYLKSFGDPVPLHMQIATILGVGFTVLVGTGLMAWSSCRAAPATTRTPHLENGMTTEATAHAEAANDGKAASARRSCASCRGPGDINANGHIFGGWVLSQMDIAAGIVASREAEGSVATVAIQSMEFIQPILLHDIVAVYAWVERIGRTSIQIRIEVFASRNRGREEVKVTEGLFTFVALDEQARPRPVRRD
jgi:acyl-CoA thioesterase YciA